MLLKMELSVNRVRQLGGGLHLTFTVPFKIVSEQKKNHPLCVTLFQNERVKTEITCAAFSERIW